MHEDTEAAMKKKQSRVMLTKFADWSETQFNRQWDNVSASAKFYNTQSCVKFDALYCGPSAKVPAYIVEMQIDRKELMGIGEVSTTAEPLMGRGTVRVYGGCQDALRFNNYGYAITRRVSAAELRAYIGEFEWGADDESALRGAKLDVPLRFDDQMNDGHWLRMLEHRLLRGKGHLIRGGGIHHAKFMEFYGDPGADDAFFQRIGCIFRAVERRRAPASGRDSAAPAGG